MIAGQKPKDHLKNLDGISLRRRKWMKLGDVRIHHCRHSCASRALALGEGLTMIAPLLGHRKETTARYAHLAQDSVRESAIRAFDSIAADMLGDYRPALPAASSNRG